MVRRRTATLSLTAAALVLAAPLITSCAAEHPGTAAVVGGRTISVTTLQNRVNQLRAAQAKVGQDVALSGQAGGLNRVMLTNLLSTPIADRAAADHGVTVTRGETMALKASDAKVLGGAARLQAALMQQFQVAPGAPTDAFYRKVAQQDGIGRAIGADTRTKEGQDAVKAELAKAARELHIDVNPRYGTWSNAHNGIGDASTRWVRSESAAPQQPSALTG